mmetsp:Transcript_47334/g.98216  ORF Transcript_47334/g.98216 Transcript_47334/m.98216 type:complete len:87 (-) Transcript_47334:301-561(-)
MESNSNNDNSNNNNNNSSSSSSKRGVEQEYVCILSISQSSSVSHHGMVHVNVGKEDNPMVHSSCLLRYPSANLQRGFRVPVHERRL